MTRVSVLMLSQIIESTRAWRDAWISIATFQSRMVDEFDGMYAPIIGSSETQSPRKPVETDPAILARTNRLRREYDELRDELAQELNAVEERMIHPAEHAKESVIPMKKTIKQRNDKKVSQKTACFDAFRLIPLGRLILSDIKAVSTVSSISRNAPSAIMPILPKQSPS